MEKKPYALNTLSPAAIGQVNVSTSAHFELDITPKPSQGTGYLDRSGRKITITSMYFQYQFYQQASALHATKIRIYIVATTGVTISGATTPKFLLPKSVYRSIKYL